MTKTIAELFIVPRARLDVLLRPRPATCLRYANGVPCMITFIETPIFTRSLRRHLSDDEYRMLQLALLLEPGRGRLIVGGGGLRKLRSAARGRGKRGGLRAIYYWVSDEQICFMLYLYAKNEQGDLTSEQTRALVRLTRAEFP